MARRNHWIKLYVEINDDPKIGLLPVNARWRFISALALAGELDDGGFIPPVNDELAYRLHTEVETLQAEMRMLAGRGLAELRMHPDGEERWFLSHFAERQAPSTPTQRAQKSRWTPPDKKAADTTWRMELYKPLPKSSGVYMISFVGTNKAYIGSSKDIQRRIQAHLTEMVNIPGHVMSGPYRAVGPRGIDIQILDEVPESELYDRETYWIGRYQGQIELLNTESVGKRHYRRNANATNSLTETETEAETETEYRKRGEGSGAIAPATRQVVSPIPGETFQPIPESVKSQKRRAGVEDIEGDIAATAPAAVRMLARLSGYWPGADVSDALATRFGDVPDEGALTRAVELWRLSGNKPTNWLGIADWYDELRRDLDWTPQARFKKSNGSAAATPRTVSKPAPGSQPVTW